MVPNEPKRRGRPPKPKTEELFPIEKKDGRGSAGYKNLPQNQTNLEPGDNSNYLRHAMMTMSLPPIDISSAAQVEERVMWYFSHCAESDMKPTVKGLCNALGIHRDTIHTWKTGERRAGTHKEIVLKAYDMMEELWEDYMLNGKINPVSGIFLGKNLWGYADKQEYVVTPNTGNNYADVDMEAIEAKYAELPDD